MPQKPQPLTFETSLRVRFYHFLFVLLTRLIAYGAGCLACRLAGRLALSTAAFLHGILQNLCVQGLNMLHLNFPPVFLSRHFYLI